MSRPRSRSGQMLWHRSAREIHEGRASTLPGAVKDSGDQSLAAAASLTREQDRWQPPRFAGHQALDLRPHGLDRRSFSNQFGQGIHGASPLRLLLNSLLSFLPL